MNDAHMRPAPIRACPVPLPTPDRTMYGPNRTVQGHYFSAASMALHGQRCYAAGLDTPPAAAAPASSVASKPEYGYTEAFYEIAALLGIGAQNATPETVFQTQMLPKLRALIAAEHDRFATPPDAAVRQPLTEAQITAAMHEADWPPAILPPVIKSKLRQFARAIERVHGIGAQE